MAFAIEPHCDGDCWKATSYTGVTKEGSTSCEAEGVIGKTYHMISNDSYV